MCSKCDWPEWNLEAAELADHTRLRGLRELAGRMSAVAATIQTEEHVSEASKRALHLLRAEACEA